jgi:hypothetical protein
MTQIYLLFSFLVRSNAVITMRYSLRAAREAGIITLQVIARGLDTTMSSLLRGL